MADLKSLFAKAKESNGQAGTGNVVANPSSTSESAVVSVSTGGTESVQAAAGTNAEPAGQPSDSKPKRFGVGSGDTGGPATSESVPGSGTPSIGEQPKPGLRTLFKSAGTQHSDSDSSGVDTPSLDSLDALNSSEDEGIQPASGPSVAYFADETPATKPTRELPEGITKEALGFVETLDTIYEIIHDPDLLGGVIRNIMIELKSNAEYVKLMSPDDFRTMVRGMRESMGLARVKKQETKAKKSTGGSRKSKALDDDVMAGLDDILGGINL